MSLRLVIRTGFEPVTHSLEGICKLWKVYDLQLDRIS